LEVQNDMLWTHELFTRTTHVYNTMLTLSTL